jgi:hypothetical protein
MLCIITGIITCLVCYLIVKNQLRQKDPHSLPKEMRFDISDHRRLSERYLQTIRENRKLLLGKGDYDPVFVMMNNWYIRLGEIYRHDEDKQKEVIIDWLQYLDNTSRAMAAHYAWLENYDRDAEYDRKYYAEQEKFHLELEEIENRFAGLMNKETELAGGRLRAAIESTYFPDSDMFDVLLTELYGTTTVTDIKKMQKLQAVLEKMHKKGEKIIFHKRNKKLANVLKTKLRLT